MFVLASHQFPKDSILVYTLLICSSYKESCKSESQESKVSSATLLLALSSVLLPPKKLVKFCWMPHIMPERPSPHVFVLLNMSSADWKLSAGGAQVPGAAQHMSAAAVLLKLLVELSAAAGVHGAHIMSAQHSSAGEHIIVL